MSRWSRELDRFTLDLETALAHDPATKKEHEKLGMFEYIPLDPEQFLNQMAIATGFFVDRKLKDDELTFMDVGCGIGSKLKLARDNFGWAEGKRLKVFGLEYSQKYVDIAKRFVGSDAAFKVMDAREFDYAGINIVYFYCPMLDPTKQRELEKQIYTTVSKNTIIIANLFKHQVSEMRKMGVFPLWGRNHFVKR